MSLEKNKQINMISAFLIINSFKIRRKKCSNNGCISYFKNKTDQFSVIAL